MLYGPDTLLCGAAAVQVAGEKNAVAVAGLVNGVGSFGPIVQEQVIGLLVRGHVKEGIRNTYLLAFSVSVVAAVLLTIIAWKLRITRVESDQRT